MEIGANICKSKNVILPGMKNFNLRYLKKYSSDMTECLHSSGHVTDNLPTNFGDDISINKKVDMLSLNIALHDFND